MSTGQGQPSEEELRAAYEAEIKRIRVEQILLENIVTLVNLGMRKTGMAPGTEDEKDTEQVRVAIEAIRALLPLVEATVPQQAGPIRDALSQLQMAFVRIGGAAAPATGETGETGGEGAPPPAAGAQPPPSDVPSTPGDADPANPDEPGPAQRSGRLWVPGQ
jgi:hypothetical protein